MTNWYHGTPLNFEHFSVDFLGRGNDQLGSGFYFTDNIDTAVGYAQREVDGGEQERTVFRVDLNIQNPVPDAGGLKLEQIGEMLQRAPEYLDCLINFGDVDWEGEAKVLREAASTYLRVAEADTLRALYTIANDFYQGNDALFLKIARDVTGYDGLVRRVGDETHAVAWAPDQIIIMERTRVSPVLRPGI